MINIFCYRPVSFNEDRDMNSEPPGDTETGTGDGEYDYDLTAGGPGGLQMAKDLTINVNVKINNKEYGDSYENGDYYDDSYDDEYERSDEVVRKEEGNRQSMGGMDQSLSRSHFIHHFSWNNLGNGMDGIDFGA